MIKQRSLSLAILAGVLAAGAGSISAHATDCIGGLAPGSYNSLNVPANKSCQILGSVSVTVAGNVTVGKGATLLVVSPAQFTVNSSLLAAGALLIRITPGPSGAVNILGSVSVTGTTNGVVILDSFIGGTLSVANSVGGGIDLATNNVAGNVLDVNNTTAVAMNNSIDTNTIGASLVCTGNRPAGAPIDNGLPNTVGGAKVGQCSGL